MISLVKFVAVVLSVVISIWTPSVLLFTQPASPFALANWYTKGLNPTPWTIPDICIWNVLIDSKIAFAKGFITEINQLEQESAI